MSLNGVPRRLTPKSHCLKKAVNWNSPQQLLYKYCQKNGVTMNIYANVITLSKTEEKWNCHFGLFENEVEFIMPVKFWSNSIEANKMVFIMGLVQRDPISKKLWVECKNFNVLCGSIGRSGAHCFPKHPWASGTRRNYCFLQLARKGTGSWRWFQNSIPATSQWSSRRCRRGDQNHAECQSHWIWWL